MPLAYLQQENFKKSKRLILTKKIFVSCKANHLGNFNGIFTKNVSYNNVKRDEKWAFALFLKKIVLDKG